MRPHAQGIVDRLRRDGIARVPFRVEVRRLREHLLLCPTYNAHVAAKATMPPVRAAIAPWNMFCHAMADVVAAPILFENALDFLPIAREYFDGERPILYSMNAFWTQPAPGPEYRDTHWWHRDGDDRRQLALFVYGTDVTSREAGAHLYQRGSHRSSDGDLGYGHEAPPEGVVEEVTGAAGTMFLTDPSGLHMGIRPSARRLLAWARYGVSERPRSYDWDKLSPAPRERLGDRYPADPGVQEQIRLVVA